MSTSSNWPAPSGSAGHRTTCDRRQGCSPEAGKEKGPTTVGFLCRAVAWFNGHGIECRRVLRDRGSADTSHGWRKACQAMGLKAKKTRPYTPQTNSKAVRFFKTLLEAC